MAIKKPERRMTTSQTKPSETLMGNQDTLSKGDSTRRKKGKCITFWVTEEQKQTINAYAAEHDMSVSRLIIEGLEMRMNRDGI